MLDLPSWSRGVRRGTESLGQNPAALGPKLPEPPEFRAHPFAPPGTCVDCGRSVATTLAVPRCWECARPLCADCFWHHRLAPADHLCSACAGHGSGTPSVSTSGGIAHHDQLSVAASGATGASPKVPR